MLTLTVVVVLVAIWDLVRDNFLQNVELDFDFVPAAVRKYGAW